MKMGMHCYRCKSVFCKRLMLLLLVGLLSPIIALPQQYNWLDYQDNNSANPNYKASLLLYPELYYRNIKFDKVYDVLINLSPALNVPLWRGMTFTGQVVIPIVNTYGDRYKDIRPGYVTLAQQFQFNENWRFRATVGTFNNERWGGDLKVYHPFKNDRFSMSMQVGVTGPSVFRQWSWHYGDPERVTFNVGGHYFYPRCNLQFDLTAGRYLGGDYGGRAQMTRHFRAASIGFFAMKTNKIDINGGFYLAIALPPYKRKKNREFRVGMADYFQLEYRARTDFYGKTYRTDPGESIFEGYIIKPL